MQLWYCKSWYSEYVNFILNILNIYSKYVKFGILKMYVVCNQLPQWLRGKEPTYKAIDTGDGGLVAGLGRSLWGRKWQPTPVFLPGESLWTEERGWLKSTGSQRVGHN